MIVKNKSKLLGEVCLGHHKMCSFSVIQIKHKVVSVVSTGEKSHGEKQDNLTTSQSFLELSTLQNESQHDESTGSSTSVNQSLTRSSRKLQHSPHWSVAELLFNCGAPKANKIENDALEHLAFALEEFANHRSKLTTYTYQQRIFDSTINMVPNVEFENFSICVVVDLLIETSFNQKVLEKIIGNLYKTNKDGLYYFFSEKNQRFLPLADVDCTSLACITQLNLNYCPDNKSESDHLETLKRTAEKIIENTVEAEKDIRNGVIQTYFKNDSNNRCYEIKGAKKMQDKKNKICEVVCLQAVRFLILLDKKIDNTEDQYHYYNQVKDTIDYLKHSLTQDWKNKREHGSRYYPSVEQILYFLHRTCQSAPDDHPFKKDFEKILFEKTLETIVTNRQFDTQRHPPNQISNIDISIHLIILSSYINKYSSDKLKELMNDDYMTAIGNTNEESSASSKEKSQDDPTTASDYVRLQTEEKLPKPFDTLTRGLSEYLTNINDDESSTASTDSSGLITDRDEGLNDTQLDGNNTKLTTSSDINLLSPKQFSKHLVDTDNLPRPATFNASAIESHNLKNGENSETPCSTSRRSSKSSDGSKIESTDTDAEIGDGHSSSPASSPASSRDGSPIDSNLTDLNQLLDDYTKVAIQHIQRHQADSYVWYQEGFYKCGGHQTFFGTKEISTAFASVALESTRPIELIDDYRKLDKYTEEYYDEGKNHAVSQKDETFKSYYEKRIDSFVDYIKFSASEEKIDKYKQIVMETILRCTPNWEAIEVPSNITQEIPSQFIVEPDNDSSATAEITKIGYKSNLLEIQTTWLFLFFIFNEMKFGTNLEQFKQKTYAIHNILSFNATDEPNLAYHIRKGWENFNSELGSFLKRYPRKDTTWKHSFVDSMKTLCDHLYEEKRVEQSNSKLDTYDDYKEIRSVTIGLHPWMQLVKLALDLNFDQLDTKKFIKECEAICAEVIFLCNDLGSIKKDGDGKEKKANAVFIVEKQHKLNRIAAKKWVAKKHEEKLKELLAKEEEIDNTTWEKSEKDQARKYVQHLLKCCVGSYDAILSQQNRYNAV